MNDKTKFVLIGILVGGIAVWLFTNATFNSNYTNMMRSANVAQNPMQNSNTLDAHFIEQMIPHHEDAITMAKLAQTKAQRAEVKELANNIIDSQGKEIDQMKSWYKDWFGKDVPANNQVMNQHGMMETGNTMHMGMMGNESDITRLEDATDFDKVFVEEMIPHHQMAVMMATMLKNGTNRAEMKKLADDIITAQNKEIDQMRQWYKAWGY